MPNMQLIESIRRVETDIHDTKDRIKVLAETRKANIAELPEYTQLAELLAQVVKARQELKSAVKGDTDISKMGSELEKERFKLTDLKEMLSHHLVLYREQSKNAYIEQEESTKVRPIILSAKLGKPEYHQEALPIGAN